MLPWAPIRQWVLSVTIPLRLVLASHPDVLSRVLAVVRRALQCDALTRAAAGTETSALTAEGDQVFGMVVVAAHPEESILTAPAFEIIVERPLYLPRQTPSLRRQVRFEAFRKGLARQKVRRADCGDGDTSLV